MEKIIKELQEFVKNGGRLRYGEEPAYGEPFYDEHMHQYISANFSLGDKVRITTESKAYDGIIIDIGAYHLTTLTSGRTVHKDRRNKCSEPFSDIKSIELLKKTDGKFDLSAVDPQEYERRMNIKKMKETREWEEIENRETNERMERRAELKQQFASIYPDADYDKSHVIKITDGCSIYFPYMCDDVRANLYLILDNGKCIKKIPCQTGTPFLNKNSYHAYNCVPKQGYPCVYTYLPDNGFVYEDVSIACVWTISITKKSGIKSGIKVADLYRIGQIDPITDEHNLIPIHMSIYPLLGHNNIKDCIGMGLLTMMNKDIYGIVDAMTGYKDSENSTEGLHIIKATEDNSDMKSTVEILYELSKYYGDHLTDGSSMLISAYIEVFVTIDKEAACYYSDSGVKCRDGYQFKALDVDSTVIHKETR